MVYNAQLLCVYLKYKERKEEKKLFAHLRKNTTWQRLIFLYLSLVLIYHVLWHKYNNAKSIYIPYTDKSRKHFIIYEAIPQLIRYISGTALPQLLHQLSN